MSEDKSLADRLDDDDDDETDDSDVGRLREWSKIGDKVANGAKAVGGTIADAVHKIPTPAENMRDSIAAGSWGGSMDGYTHKGDAKDMTVPPVPPAKQIQDFAPTPSAKEDPGVPEDVETSKGGLTGKFDGPSDKAFIKGLQRFESYGGDPKARPPIDPETGKPVSSAKGKMQFTDRWDGDLKKWTGYTSEEAMPKNNSKEELDRANKIQDAQARAYYENFLYPTVQKLKSEGATNGMSDQALAALVHHEGEAGARKYLATGKSDNDNKGGNRSIDDYLSKVERASGGGGSSAVIASTHGSTPGGSNQATLGNIGSEMKPPNLELDNNPGFAQQVSFNPQQASGRDGKTFEDRLNDLEAKYDAEKDSIAKRELGHTIADALTKMAGGYSGMKTGIDMSHIQTDKHDFSKDYELNQNERKTSLDDLKARRQEQAAQMQHDQDRGDRRAEFGADLKVRHNANQVALYSAVTQNDRMKIQQLQDQARDNLSKARIDLQQNKEDRDLQEKAQIAFQNMKAVNSAKIASIYANKDYDDDSRAAAAHSVLTGMGVDNAEATKAVSDPTWWARLSGGEGRKAKDPIEAMNKAGLLIENLHPRSPLQEIAESKAAAGAPSSGAKGIPIPGTNKVATFKTQADEDEFKRKAGM